MNIPQHIWLTVLWLLYGAVHSILASGKIKRRVQHFGGRVYKYYRPLYSLFAAVSLTGILYYHIYISSIFLWRSNIAEEIIAVAFAVPAIIIMFICVRKYFFYLSGIDVMLGKTAHPVLQIEGLNKYMRHPLYSGTLLFIWCIFLFMPLLKNLIGCLCITAYTIAGIYLEEKKLIKEFGNAYKQYASKVPMLIPKIF